MFKFIFIIMLTFFTICECNPVGQNGCNNLAKVINGSDAKIFDQWFCEGFINSFCLVIQPNVESNPEPNYNATLIDIIAERFCTSNVTEDSFCIHFQPNLEPYPEPNFYNATLTDISTEISDDCNCKAGDSCRFLEFAAWNEIGEEFCVVEYATCVTAKDFEEFKEERLRRKATTAVATTAVTHKFDDFQEEKLRNEATTTTAATTVVTCDNFRLVEDEQCEMNLQETKMKFHQLKGKFHRMKMNNQKLKKTNQQLKKTIHRLKKSSSE